MRTLFQLNVTANWGSTGKIAEGIGQAAINQGWESFIAYGRDMNPSESRLIKVGNQFDVYAHYARHRLFDGEGLGSKGATNNLIKKIEQIAPDIIHLHNIHDHWLNYPLLFEYIATIDTPIVWTFHDCWAFTGGCPHFEVRSCDKWRIQCEKCPIREGKIDKSRQQYNRRRELIASLGDRLTIVPVSNWLEKFCNDSLLAKSNIQLIHNGIDISKFYIRDSVQRSNPIVLGVSNIWTSRKGLNDFVELRTILPSEIRIILVGLTQSQITKLPNGIEGITRTQNVDELVNLYNQASVLVNPTYADTFPTVNLEALACGTPVVTYRTGGSPEAIDKNTGIVVEKGDVQGLAASVMQIIDNPQKFSREACRKRAEQHYNQDFQFGKYIDLYNSLLSDSFK